MRRNTHCINLGKAAEIKVHSVLNNKYNDGFDKVDDYVENAEDSL